MLAPQIIRFYPRPPNQTMRTKKVNKLLFKNSLITTRTKKGLLLFTSFLLVILNEVHSELNHLFEGGKASLELIFVMD